jgi:chromosome segregation ATPase
LQADLSTLKSQISTTKNKLQELQSDKAVHELRLSRLENELESLKSAQDQNKSEIHKAGRVQVGVVALQNQANTMISDADTLEAGLQDIKHTLTQCAASLSSESSQLTTHDSVMTSVMKRLRPKRVQQAKDFNRNKVIIAQVMTALSNTKAALPMLLQGTQMKFLQDAS